MKLAANGMKKNGKLYFPYLLTCMGMVAMGYILQSISVCSLLKHMKGGASVSLSLSLGKFVVAVFAAIFLPAPAKANRRSSAKQRIGGGAAV